MYWALRDAGRDDIGMELLERNQEYQQEAERRIEGHISLSVYDYVYYILEDTNIIYIFKNIIIKDPLLIGLSSTLLNLCP